MKHDIKGMTREEKLKLYDLLQEKKKRLKLTKESYEPNSGQLPIHLSKASIRFCASGNGAGKTTAAVHEAWWAAQGYHPLKREYTKVPADIAVVLDKPDKADTVWLKEARKWFSVPENQVLKKGKPSTSQINFDNGSTITFFSHEQDPLTFESIELDAAIYDEPPPRHIFIALRRATRKQHSVPWHLIIGTPLTEAWLRLEIWEPWSKGELAEAECFRMSSDINKDNINWSEQERNYAFMSAQERLIRSQGQFFDLEGQALAHLWKRDVHIIKQAALPEPDQLTCVVAIDPHPSKAHHAVLLAVDRDGYLYVVREMAQKQVARDFARSLHSFMKGFRVIDIVSDSLGAQDMTGGEGFKSFIQVLREEGIQVRSTTYEEKSDEAFIERIRDALLIPTEEDNFGRMVPKLRALEECRGTIMNVEQVQWVRDKRLNENKPKLDIRNTDYLACLKYALATNLHANKHKAKAYSVIKNIYGMSTRPKALGMAKKLNKAKPSSRWDD